MIMKLIYGEWLSEEECFQKHGKLVFVGLRTLLPAARKIGVDPEDLISEGRIGLLLAYRKFDESLGYKFSTYAVPMIYGSARRFIRDKAKSVNYSRNILELVTKIKKYDLIHLSKKEIAIRFNVPDKLVHDAFICMRDVQSMDELFFEGNESVTFQDSIGSEADYSEVTVRHFIAGLKPTERKVIELRLKGKWQTEISKEIGITQTHVSRLLKQIGQKYLAM